MKRSLLTISLVIFALMSFAQVQLTQYFLEPTIYNPAFAGSKDAICNSVFARQQWLGFNAGTNDHITPLSFVYSIHSLLYSLHSGLGANVLYENGIGAETNTGVKLNYAYKIPVRQEKSVIILGLGLSILDKNISFSDYLLEEQGDPLLKNTNDKNGILTDLDFGLLYQSGRKFYVGVSGTNLMESSAEIGNVNYNNTRNLFLTTGYTISLINDKRQTLDLVPSILLKSNFYNMQVDINARVEYNNRYWGGLSYRHQDALAIMAGIQFSGFRVGAAYDLTIGGFQKASNGSAELFIGYCYSITPKVILQSLYNTRYL